MEQMFLYAWDVAPVGSDGNLYGLAGDVVFTLTLAGQFTALHTFREPDYTRIALLEGTDGHLRDDAAGIFRLVPQPVLTGRHSEGRDVLTWTSFVGGVYKVEYKAAFALSSWTVLPLNITATEGTVSATNTVGLSREGLLPRVSVAMKLS